MDSDEEFVMRIQRMWDFLKMGNGKGMGIISPLLHGLMKERGKRGLRKG